MNIAYISYEYPTENGGGGIGTYIMQISEAMAKTNNYVEVFAATEKESYQIKNEENLVLNFVHTTHNSFSQNVSETFNERNQLVHFDIIECAEYGADAKIIRQKITNIPLVVKLHAPGFIFKLFGDYYYDYVIKKSPIKFIKEQIFRLRHPQKADNIETEEYNMTKAADAVCSPSTKLKDIIARRWHINGIKVIPNIYIHKEIQSKIISNKKFTILFIGKLSVLKGCIDLIEIANILSKAMTEFKILVVGQDLNFDGDTTMMNYMKQHLSIPDVVEFVGFKPLGKIHEYYLNSDLFICPSLFENFPTVILEAMNYRCPVVAYKVGGIPELIENNKTGLLIQKHDCKAFANAILKLYKSSKLRTYLTDNAYESLKNRFSPQRITPIITDFYQETINKKNEQKDSCYNRK